MVVGRELPGAFLVAGDLQSTEPGRRQQVRIPSDQVRLEDDVLHPTQRHRGASPDLASIRNAGPKGHEVLVQERLAVVDAEPHGALRLELVGELVVPRSESKFGVPRQAFEVQPNARGRRHGQTSDGARVELPER